MPSLRPAQLHSFVVHVCTQLGSESVEAHLVADQLVAANLAGHDSHGVGMLPSYVGGALAGTLNVNRHATVVTDSGPVLLLDGNRGFGQVMGHEAMTAAVERATTHGVALVGLRNSFHIGRIGHWGEQCAAAGLVSIHFANVSGHEPLVAPYGGADARFGTNPFCVSVPGTGIEPALLLDMATSKIALGKARVAHNKGEPVPPDTLLDGDGRVTNDPAGMFAVPRQGALIAMGDHKGSGLAIVCELLGAALLAGLVMSDETAKQNAIINNMLTIAIDPRKLGTAAVLADEVGAYLDYVRASSVREGFDEVLVPGEPERRSRIDRAAGFDVDATTLHQLRNAALAAGMSAEAIDSLLTETPPS